MLFSPVGFPMPMAGTLLKTASSTGGGMPAGVIVPAAASLGGQIFSGVMQNSANKRAARDQRRANDKAMAWEKEKYADEKRLREQELQWRNAARRALFDRYGIEAPEMGTLGSIGAPPQMMNRRTGAPIAVAPRDGTGAARAETYSDRYDENGLPYEEE